MRRHLSTAEAKGSRTDDALALVGARFEGIVLSAMDAIVCIDAEQRIILFNPAAEKMFGISAADALGLSLAQLMPERFRAGHASEVERFAQTGVSNRKMGALGCVTGLRANGEEFPLEVSISQVEVSGERIFTAIVRDITARMQAEEALRRSHEELEALVAERTAQLRQSVADLEEFSYAVVHDIRAPLRAMQTFTGLLLEECAESTSGPSLDYARRISAAAARLDQLLQDTLAYSQIAYQDLPLLPVDIGKVLRDLLGTYLDLEAGAEIRVDLDGVVVRGNEIALTQCFSNLLTNAFKFVAPGVRPRVRVWAERGEGTVRIWVQDNGIGIEKEAHAKIFALFERMHRTDEYPGTGIGLAIVRRAVERMGGKVGLESEPGMGSRFWVELTTEKTI